MNPRPNAAWIVGLVACAIERGTPMADQDTTSTVAAASPSSDPTTGVGEASTTASGEASTTGPECEAPSCASGDAAPLPLSQPVVVGRPPRPPVQLAASAAGYYCLLRAEGSVFCRNIPRVGDDMFVAPAAGQRFSMIVGVNGLHPLFFGVDLEGHLHCFGRPDICDHVALPPGRFVQIAASEDLLCGLRETKTLTCQMLRGGDDPLVPPLQIFTAIAVAGSVVCALRPDDRAVCFGSAWENTPTPPGPFVQLAGSYGYMIGLRPDGTVAVWGRYTLDGEKDGLPHPPATLPRFDRVWATHRTAAGRTVEGRIVAWSARNIDELGHDFVDFAAAQVPREYEDREFTRPMSACGVYANGDISWGPVGPYLCAVFGR